ncbi:MAG: universal stress protein, partial [Alphaproteobacteria bacterium]
MKTIFVPTSGSETDHAVFRTALCAARPLQAHLEFFHVRVGLGDAAFYTPHVEFARGRAVEAALSQLQQEEASRSAAASRHFHAFCKQMKIDVIERPNKRGAVTARWCEEENNALERITLRARHNDLVVVGRATRPNGLPLDLLERILLTCGRPLLIAPVKPPRTVIGTVMVCWKETPEAARAVTAALPLLAKAKRVVFVAIVENGEPSLESLRDIAHQMAWHGIRAKARLVAKTRRPAAEQLALTAAEHGADLMVMGGYGHSRARELIFGGCTQFFLDHADI